MPTGATLCRRASGSDFLLHELGAHGGVPFQLGAMTVTAPLPGVQRAADV
jgi:hypothetical protein